MLWLALRFPDLPLEIHTRGSAHHGPLAVADLADARARILLCNPAAASQGVHPGMTAASACALCGDLRLVPRNEAAEREALENIAAWACQFTPQTSIAAADEVVLEIGGSLAVFGGQDKLRGRIRDGLAKLGYSCGIAGAPTPQAAQWLARAGSTACIDNPARLQPALEPLPLGILPQTTAAALQRFGMRRIGDALRLPRDSLARRLGPLILAEFDRALGRHPDPRLPFVPPRIFRACIELPAPAVQGDALLFAARRLCLELCGHLAARSQGVLELGWLLRHEDRDPTPLQLRLVTASRDAAHLLLLLRERLARERLRAPVVALELCCAAPQALAPGSGVLVADGRKQADAAIRLLETLQARLGPDAVCMPVLEDDHRPEKAWRACTASEAAAHALREVRTAAARRPLWLLASPQALQERGAVPQHEGPLSLLSGPERIESGWWDDAGAARDYFIAAGAGGALLWVYRERGTGGGWFLHGFFG